MQHEQQFKDSLRAAGERLTTSRLSVFRVLARHSPIPMPKLIGKAAENGVDPVTTYRTIDLFRKLSLVQEVGIGRNRMFELSDNYHAHHHHFTCVNCGKIFDFDSNIIEADLQRVSAEFGFEIHSHQLETSGLCEHCRNLSARQTQKTS
jgi:Fur family ferric uptake transcriptional regulator